MASYLLMNTGFSIGIGDVTPGENLIRRKNALLEDGYYFCFNIISYYKLEFKLKVRKM